MIIPDTNCHDTMHKTLIIIMGPIPGQFIHGNLHMNVRNLQIQLGKWSYVSIRVTQTLSCL